MQRIIEAIQSVKDGAESSALISHQLGEEIAGTILEMRSSIGEPLTPTARLIIQQLEAALQAAKEVYQNLRAAEMNSEVYINKMRGL